MRSRCCSIRVASLLGRFSEPLTDYEVQGKDISNSTFSWGYIPAAFRLIGPALINHASPLSTRSIAGEGTSNPRSLPADHVLPNLGDQSRTH